MPYEITDISNERIESQRAIEVSKRVFEARILHHEYEDNNLRKAFMDDWSTHTKSVLGTSSGIYRLTTTHEIIVPYEHD